VLVWTSVVLVWTSVVPVAVLVVLPAVAVVEADGCVVLVVDGLGVLDEVVPGAA
jgi:hypothetical protein